MGPVTGWVTLAGNGPCATCSSVLPSVASFSPGMGSRFFFQSSPPRLAATPSFWELKPKTLESPLSCQQRLLALPGLEQIPREPLGPWVHQAWHKIMPRTHLLLTSNTLTRGRRPVTCCSVLGASSLAPRQPALPATRSGPPLLDPRPLFSATRASPRFLS